MTNIKRRLKRKVKVFLIISSIVVITGTYYIYTTVPTPTMEETIATINIENVEQDFLLWLNKQYPQEWKQFYDEYLEEYDPSLWHKYFNNSYLVLRDQYLGNNEAIIKEGNTITILGDTGFADNYFGGKKYDLRGKKINGLLSTNVLEHLFSQSLVIANAEFAVGEGGSPTPNKLYTFLGSKDRAKIFQEMNVGLVTLANNHIHDFGPDVFKQTLQIYPEIGIQKIGAGKNLEEASKAAYYIINGYKFAFVNANRSEKNILTPGATENQPGVFRCYDPSNLITTIREEDTKADYVIPILHWGAEDSHKIEDELLKTSHMYIDAGADAIIGHHAHVLQGIEFYNNTPIFYNLGNFLFDEDVDGGMVQITIQDHGELEYKFLPTHQEDIFTDFLYEQDSLDLIDTMNSWGIHSHIDSTGKVVPTN